MTSSRLPVLVAATCVLFVATFGMEIPLSAESASREPVALPDQGDKPLKGDPLLTHGDGGEKHPQMNADVFPLPSSSPSSLSEEGGEEGEEGGLEEDKNSLAEALRVLRRRKRKAVGSHRPYSAYRSVGNHHRYRYPLTRKRSASRPYDYSDYDNTAAYANDMASYDDDDYAMEFEPRPSLFRERVSGPSRKLISNAHTSTRPLFQKRFSRDHYNNLLNSAPTPLNMMDYNYENPLSYNDLNALSNRLYEQKMEGRQDRPAGRQERNSVRRNDVPRDEYSRLFNTLTSINSNVGRTHYFPDEAKDMTNSNLLKSIIEDYGKKGPLHSAMIRRKRTPQAPSPSTSSSPSSSLAPLSSSSPLEPPSSSTSITTNHTTPDQTHEHHTKSLPKLPSMHSDRQKRAYPPRPLFYDPEQEDENDFLTREYFKSIARTVGSKNKRMAFATFEAHKRANTLDEFLENPNMLRYLQQQIQDAEEELAKEAENKLKGSPTLGGVGPPNAREMALFRNSISRLDALDRMRQALSQLEELQEREVLRKRAQSLVADSERDADKGEEEEREGKEKEKRRKALKGRLIREGQMEEEEERIKRKEDTLRTLLNGNAREDCPVLERIGMSCAALTEAVNDEAMVFLEPCLRHEVCYMCGSGLGVSRHECDALLSSALESSCAGAAPDGSAPRERDAWSLDCLSAAGETYNLLGGVPARYDADGTCTFDPCVRQLLESR